MSVALDTEEAQRHERYLLAGGDPKKYKAPPPPVQKEKQTANQNPFQVLMNALGASKMKISGRKGSARELAMIKGKVYKNTETGEYFDEHGNRVEAGPNAVFVPLDKGG